MADDITTNIKRITSRHILVVADSCYSGTLTRGTSINTSSKGSRTEFLKKMMGRPSRTLMASGGNEPVSDSGGGNHSVFARAFLMALSETDKGVFTAEEIFHGRIKQMVAGKSEQVPEYSDIRNSGHEGGDFIFQSNSKEIVEEEAETTDSLPSASTLDNEDAIKDPVTGMEFIFVKGVCYQMGDTFWDGNADGKPVHEVCVDDFYIGKYEVMQGEWEKVMGNNPSYFKNCGYNCPVEQVSWNDIQEFIKKLNKFPLNKGGLRGLYRLPTEAEWEYSARSGGEREKYAGGDYVDSVAWYGSNSGKKTHPVGTKSPNGLGIYDMSGNVWEWVSDWYGDKYYSESPRNNPKGPNSVQSRVLRGGSWLDGDRIMRAASRNRGNPDYRFYYRGFRLVRTK